MAILELLSQQFPICRRLRKRRKKRERKFRVVCSFLHTSHMCRDLNPNHMFNSDSVEAAKKTESITHVVRVDVRTELEPDRLLGNLILFSYVSDALSRNELLFSEIYLWTHQKVVGRARQQTESANVLCEFLLSSTFIAQLEPSAR